ncbi:hypothetical protein FHS85_003183 [Rhodoligotrophos appendicifer]|uniref:nitrate reductase n=1 Tax=Rhodoligotrophos appendicifer TaxID=987056 RepID=UPI001184BFCB|nr:nitrate reductase [Rhodoligotrophos appendicifer]
MSGFFNPFAPKARGAGDSSTRIKHWVRKYLPLPDDVVVSVNQISCREAGCPDIETVIGIFRPGEPVQKLRLFRPITDVTEGDVEEASRSALIRRPADPQ